MSLQNILKENNYELYCDGITTNNININNFTADNIESNNIKTDSLELGSVLSIPSSPLTFYCYQSSLNGQTITYGGAVPDAQATSFRAVRIGNFVAMQIGIPSVTPCTNNVSALNFLIPDPFRLLTTLTSGLCLVRKGGTSNLVARWQLGGAILSIYAGVSSTSFWSLGESVGPGGGAWNFSWVI